MSIGFTEIFLILVVVLLLFGSKRIPELAKALGKASYEFKKAKETLKKEAEGLTEDAEKIAEKESQNA
ncbi:MAG: twin-arginine translocase TatA/TatE family subunit [bacterium]|nr:twin-arginine translocase TatA/TatE family subunit [bacterium]